MLLVVDLSWGKVLERQSIYSIAGSLKKVGSIDRAIVFFPDTFDEKKLMISFVRSLQNSGVNDIRLVIRTSKFNESDLDLIRLAGQEEFILLEDDLTFHTVNSMTISVRLWLTFFAGGDNQQKVHKWKGYIRQLAAAEPAPFFARPAEQIAWLAPSLRTSHGQCNLSNAMVIVSKNMSWVPGDESSDVQCILRSELFSFLNVVPITICCGSLESSVAMNLRPFLIDKPMRYSIQSGTRDYVKGSATLLEGSEMRKILNDFKKRVKDNAVSSCV
jgi:hypothetical protein